MSNLKPCLSCKAGAKVETFKTTSKYTKEFFEENEKEKHKSLKDRKMRKDIKERQAIYSPVVAPRQNKQGVSKNNQKKKNRFITSSTAILFKSSNNDKKLLPR